MKGAENIKSVIMADAVESADKIAAEAAKKVESILAEAQKEADDFMNSQLKLAEEEGSEIVEKARTEGRLAVRRAVLSFKQQLLKEVFEKTAHHFESLEGDELVNTLVGIIRNNAQGGQVILNEETLSKYGPVIAEKLGSEFTVCEKAENIGPGAIVRQGRIEINCRFAAIVSRLMDTEAQNVSNILFGG